MFYARSLMASDKALFEIRRVQPETPEFGGIEFIEVEAKTVINHVPGGALPFSWTINPYRGCSHACVYCFARTTHTFMDMNAGRDFESKIVVKVNAPEVLRRQLASRRWKGEHIAMGTATDPYQRAEGRYRLMPRIIDALADYRNPFSILTKGTLILRDLDRLISASEVAEVSAALSIGTLDEDAWRRTEPGTPHPRKRIEAVAKINGAGIPCGVMIAPVLPGISDAPRMLRDVVAAAIDAGATHVSPILLHLRPGVKEEFMPWLEAEFPDLRDRYELMYRRPYASPQDRKTLADAVAGITRALGGLRPASPPPRWSREERRAGSDSPEQLTLG
jgi:DNA repair photolyase